MPASPNDLITDVRNAARPNSARVTSGRSAEGTTLACDNLTGWPTASKVHFVTYQIDSNSNPVAGTQLDCEGIVSGNNISSFTVNDGNDTGNAVNDVVEMLPTAAWGQDLADALMASHDRDGTLKDGAVDADDVLADGIITFPKLTTGATRLGLNRHAGGTLGASWATYATLTATSTGGVCEAEISAIVGNGNSGLDRTFDIRVLCDGAAITPSLISGLYALYVSGATPYHTYAFNFSSTPAAGSHTWALQLQASVGGAVVLADNYIKVAEVI